MAWPTRSCCPPSCGSTADGDRSWPFIEAALPIYRLECGTQQPPLGLFNHHQGHAVPEVARESILAEKDPERLERWHERTIVAASIAEVLDPPS